MASTGFKVVLLLSVITHYCVCQFPGDRCQLPDNYIGRCTDLERCPAAIRALRRNIRPQTCGFIRDQPFVCCPLRRKPNPNGGIITPPVWTPPPTPNFNTVPFISTTSPTTTAASPGKISAQKCEEYKPPSILTLTVTTIIGGRNSLAKEFPHMAALGFGDENNIHWLCGGSLISERYVVTAAHCLYSLEHGDVRHVRLGDLNLQTDNDDAAPQNFLVTNRIPHPQYKPPVRYHDIGLVTLDRPAEFTSYVRPICLQPTYELSSQFKPIATGWGKVEYAGDTSDHLMKVTLQYFSSDECKRKYESTSARLLPFGIEDANQICAGGKNEEKDTCQGDSGGPLQVFDGKFWLVGITSFGKGCGQINTPGVYTRVSYYVPWIEQIVWGSSI